MRRSDRVKEAISAAGWRWDDHFTGKSGGGQSSKGLLLITFAGTNRKCSSISHLNQSKAPWDIARVILLPSQLAE